MVPRYAHPDDSGLDLCAIENRVLQPGDWARIRTGLAIALPEGYAGFVHPRSGLALKHGLSIVNAPGTVDAAYRGELAVTVQPSRSQPHAPGVNLPVQRGTHMPRHSLSCRM